MMTMRDLEKRRKKNVTTKTTTDSKSTTKTTSNKSSGNGLTSIVESVGKVAKAAVNSVSTAAQNAKTVTTTTREQPTVKDYSGAVKYLQDRGVKGASGIMTENEWRRRKKSSGYDTYQDYLNGAIGKYGAGNINLNKQPLTTSKDGSRSTIDSVRYFDERDKKHVLLPMDIYVDGEWKRVSGDEAWKHYLDTGEHLGKFDTEDEAGQYAMQLYVDHKDYYKSVQKHDDAYWNGRYQEELERAKKEGALNPTTQALKVVDEERNREKPLYNQAKYNLKNIELVKKIRQDPNFNEYVDKGRMLADEKESGWFVEQNRRKNPVEFLRKNPKEMREYENALDVAENHHYETPLNLPILDRYTEAEYNLAKYGTEDQIKTYYAYLGKGDNKGAEQYLKSIEESLNYAKGMAIASTADTLAEKFSFSAKANFKNSIDSLATLLNFKDEYIPLSAEQIASGQVRESLEDTGPKILGNSLGQTVYDFIGTTANMAPSIILGAASNLVVPGSGAFVGAGLMGASAAGNAYQEKLNEGWGKGQARFFSTAIGVSEAALQYAMGGIGSLGGQLTNTSIKAISSGINNAVGRFAITYGGKIVSEGIEESLQEVLTPFFENLALGYAKNKWSDIELEQVAYSGVLGALSAVFLEGAPTAINTFGENRQAKKIGKVYAPVVDEVIQSGLESDTDSEAHIIAEKLQNKKDAGKTISELEIGRAAQANERAIQNERPQPTTLEQAAQEVVNDKTEKVKAAREAGSKGVPRTVLNLTTAEEVKAYNEGRQATNKSNRTSAPSYEALEALTQNNEPITAADVKKVTVFGDKGAELVANLANKEGATLSQAERTVKTAYMAGFANVESNQVSFATDTQIDAFIAGKQDRLMQDLSAKANAEQKSAELKQTEVDKFKDNNTKSVAVGMSETMPAPDAQTYNIIVSNLKRKAEELGLLDRDFFTKLQAVSSYNPTASDKALISSEFHRVFAGNTDSLVASWLDSIDAAAVADVEEITNTSNAVNDTTDNKEPVDSMYDIPEDSEIVNNIVVDEHSKRLKRENPRAYSNIIRMARRLGMNVRFVKNLTDENGKVLEGLITSKGIFINADAKNPSRFVATHEFGHRMKQAAPKVWAKYQEYVINKLKKESFGNGRTVYDVLYEETKNAYGKDDADFINEEIAVNYAGELFDSEEMLESFIREDKSLALRVRDWWYNVLESMGLLSEKKKAQQLWLKAYAAAAKNVKDGKVGEFSGERYSKKEIREIFKEQVIDAIHNPNKTDGNNVLVGYTTSILKQLGLNDRLMCMTKGHVRDINTPEDGIHSEYHGLTEQEIYDMLPTILEYPAIVFDSISKQNPNAVCILSEKTTKSGLPVIVAINPDGKGRYNDVRIISNFVLSTYGRNNPMGFLNELSKNSGKVLYINEFRTKKLLEVIYGKNKRTKEEFKGARLQLPAGLNNLRFNYILHKSENVVKRNMRENNGRIRLEDRINGEELLNAIDTIKEIRDIGGRVDNYGYVTLFHATNNESARSIVDSKKMIAKEDGLFFSTKANGEIRGYGKSVLKFKFPVEMLEKNDVFHDEIHFRLPLKNKNESIEVSDYLIVPQNKQNTAENAQEGKKSIAGTRLSELVEKYGAIPTGENPHRDVQVPRKTEKNKKVSQTVRTILEAKVTPDEALPSIEKMVEDGIFSYDTYTDKEAITDAEEHIKENGWDESLDGWFADVEKGVVSKEHTAMGWALYNNAANLAATTTTETERTTAIKTSLKILDAMVRHQRSAAQALQATRILKKLSPETQLYGVQKSVHALQNELTEKYGKKAPNLKIDEALAEQFINAKTEEERAEVEKEIYKDIGRQMPSRFIDKWNAWRYLAMLGNVRTHVRNVVGNASFVPVVAVKNLTATAIESVVHRVSGKKTIRGKSIVWGSKSDRALLKAAWGDYANVADMVSNGGKYNDFAMANQQIEEGRRIFKFKPLEWARKGNSKALEVEDVWFSKPHYAYALAQYCKANNITAEQIKNGKAIAPARDYAIKEAQKATYKDTNAFSQMVSEWGRSNKNEKNIAKKAFNTVIEGILPFRKTPANILVRGVEYSPLGFIKGIKNALVDVCKGKMTSSEAIDTISAGLTGTGLLGLGIFLAAQGLVRGHGEDEEKEKEFNELMGHQAYSLELPNGQSITLDWLAPEALPFFVGVNLWETTKGSMQEINLSSILGAVSNISEPMLEMSCLQGLNDLFEGVGYASSNDTSGLVSVVSSSLTSYLTQGIPTLFGQVERTGEENRMTTYTEKNSFLTGDVQYALGKASAKIPFWDYNQIPYIDAWGRKEASGTALKRGLNNFLNPAYTSTIETSDTENELLRLYEQTGDGGVFPERADKYFMVDGERKDLTADEYVRYATLKGEKSYKAVTDLVNSTGYKKLSDEEKAEAVKEVYDYANQKAKQAISNYKPQSWVGKADEFSNVGSYISFKTEVSSTKQENDDKISKTEVIDIILDMAQNDSEAWKMYLSEYDAKADSAIHDAGVGGYDYMTVLRNVDKYDQPNKNGKLGTYTNDEIATAIKMTSGLTNKERAILWQNLTGSSSTKNNPWRSYLP